MSAYWNTGIQNIDAKVSVGQYLAGDKGVTVDLSRSFANGVAIGGWFTKTNLSAKQFGEGSFDKGIYVRIPFDVSMLRPTSGEANITWNPLTRDGGAKLHRRNTLHDQLQLRNPRRWQYDSAQPR